MTDFNNGAYRVRHDDGPFYLVEDETGNEVDRFYGIRAAEKLAGLLNAAYERGQQDEAQTPKRTLVTDPRTLDKRLPP